MCVYGRWPSHARWCECRSMDGTEYTAVFGYCQFHEDLVTTWVHLVLCESVTVWSLCGQGSPFHGLGLIYFFMNGRFLVKNYLVTNMT